METESPRQRGRKLSSNKLSALERLKKARQGEKIEDDDEEEDLYEYVDEECDEDEEDDDDDGTGNLDRYESAKKKNKSGSSSSSNKSGAKDVAGKHSKASDTSSSSSRARHHLTKEKTSSHADDDAKPATDIRNAFFKASASGKMRKDATLATPATDENDDLANEIMQELQQKKKTSSSAATSASATRSKQSQPHPPNMFVHPSPKPSIPFSVGSVTAAAAASCCNSIRNSGHNNVALSLSPAHKRKLSPSSSTSGLASSSNNNNNNNNEAGNSSKCLKFELDDDLVQQLFDSDSQPHDDESSSAAAAASGKTHLADVSNANKAMPVKAEPVDLSEMSEATKSSAAAMSEEEREALENIELLAQLTLEASTSAALAHQLNLPTQAAAAAGACKQEPFSQSLSSGMTTTQDNFNVSAMTATASAVCDADLQMHLRQQSNSDKMVFFWLDAFEDQFNSHGTVYLFGKTPIVRQQAANPKSEASASEQTTQQQPQLSFVSVCCIVKNVPKCVYALPLKYKRSSKIKAEPGATQQQPTSGELVTMDMLKREIDAVMAKHKITAYRTRTVKKNYAFDKRTLNGRAAHMDEPIPFESEYLEIEYATASNNQQQLPSDLQGECFACLIGSQSSYLEHMLIDLRVKGPCWLLASKAKRRELDTGAMLSWCKLEFIVDDYRSLALYHEGVTLEKPNVPLPSTPPLTLLTLLTRTMLNTKSQEHEIVCAAGLVSSKFYLDKATASSPGASSKQQQQQPGLNLYDSYFCALTKPSNAVFPYDLPNVIKSMQSKFRIELCGSERALLAYLLCKIQALDVDIIVGHDLFGFNFDILLNRCVVKKAPHWSRLGRLKRSVVPSSGNTHSSSSQKNQHMATNHNGATNNLIIQQRIQTVCSGRLLCDIMLSSKELLTKCKSFDLVDLVAHILHKKQPNDAVVQQQRDYDEEKNVSNYYGNSQLLLKFLQLAMMDATYIMRICSDLQCIQLAYQITCIAGNVLSRTLVGGRSERNEFLLLHAFHDKDFILPDKYTGGGYKARQAAKNAAAVAAKGKAMIKAETTVDTTGSSECTQMDMDNENNDGGDEDTKTGIKSSSALVANKQGYQGGLVLEPRVGFYDRFILLLDFNSLYPSIIQEYNICFTTIARPENELLERDVDEYIETCIRLPGADEKPGILPMEIRKLVDSRRQVKQLMADKSISADLRMQYDIRQKALKLTANSVYGCLGFENSRFYCKPLAALITKNGRSILMKTKELVENKKIEVIYGDTDSIMINTNLNDYDQVIKLGNMLKGEVNKFYKHLEIDIDGVFKSLLLLKKKKYAALTVAGRNPKDQSLLYQQEIKGLDVVRRDWCLLAKQIGERVISEILSGQSCDQVLANINKILNETAEKIKNNAYDLSVFEISKQLNRNPEDYSDSGHQSHVLVALRHNNDVNNSKKFKSGNVVSYVICEDSSGNSATQRAYSKSELLKSPDKLTLDTKYYLTQQIHPVVSRLCEPIEGIDAYHVAESLGLDPAGFKHRSGGGGGASSTTLSIAPPQLSKQQKKLENYMNELDKFANCQPFKYTCPDCKHESVWQSPFVKIDESKPSARTSSSSNTQASSASSAIGMVNVKKEQIEQLMKMESVDYDDDDDDIDIDEGLSSKSNRAAKPAFSSNFKCILDACSNTACKSKPSAKIAFIKNAITIQLNKFIKQYYQSWLVCEDPMCSFRSKRISCKFAHGKPVCVECERYGAELEYTHADLYYQMKFFKFVFDVDAYKFYYKDDVADINGFLRHHSELPAALAILKEQVDRKLRHNAYGSVNLTEIFKYI